VEYLRLLLLVHLRQQLIACVNIAQQFVQQILFACLLRIGLDHHCDEEKNERERLEAAKLRKGMKRIPKLDHIGRQINQTIGGRATREGSD